MLNDATCFKQVYIVCGYTDLRFGLDSLASIIESKMGCKPSVPDTLYLFCGRKTDRIKGLVWEKETLCGQEMNLMYEHLPVSSSVGLWKGLRFLQRKPFRRSSHRNIWHDVCAKGRNLKT